VPPESLSTLSSAQPMTTLQTRTIGYISHQSTLMAYMMAKLMHGKKVFSDFGEQFASCCVCPITKSTGVRESEPTVH
jgi:hypothetical protein